MRVGGTLAVGAVVLVALAVPRFAYAAPINDDYAQRLPMQLGSVDSRSNAEATIEPAERLTENDPAGLHCDKSGQAAAQGVRIQASLWWSFTGNGGPITVSTASSGFDTVLAVYEVPTNALLGCNDDIQPLDPSREALGARVTSELVLDTVAGREYAVHAGGCSGECATVTSGTIALRVSPAPANDDRAGATELRAGVPLDASSYGATLEPAEQALCGANPYAKTVWFRYRAPAAGTAVFSSSGFDTVLAVYRGDSPLPLGCNDDAVTGELAGSQLPMREPPGPPFEVLPGDYLIQVGGAYNTGFSTIAARNGPLSVQVQFSEDLDLDDDGILRDRDCDDQNAGIHPGAIEIANNDADENCDGTRAFDRDADGYLARPAGGDCDDARASVHPGARERRGNRVDENCDGKALPLRVLKTAIEMRSKRFDPPQPYTAVRELFVGPVSAGSKVLIRCRGGCPFQSKGPIAVRQARGKLVVAHGFRLKPGAELEVRVTKPGWIGRAKTFGIRLFEPRTESERCIGPDQALRSCGRV